MKRILIISTSLDEEKKIQEAAQIHNPGAFKVETTASFSQDVNFWQTQAPDVLVLQIPQDPLLQGYFFTKLRKDVPTKQPMIVLCSMISAALMQLSTEYSKVRIFKTPVDGFSLHRALSDILQSFQSGKEATHPRYLTDLSVDVHSDFHDGMMKAHMKNLSLSGAYFETLDRDFPLAQGDLAKISILVGEPAKHYVFDFRVVWEKAIDNGQRGFGVTFVNKEEVYNQLLKNL